MIKWIAMLLMVADHIGYYFNFLIPQPVYFALRLAGRLSFPVFAYSAALGFLRTSDRVRYFRRMFLAAAAAQAAMAAAQYYTGTPAFLNVMFTFSLAILLMASYELMEASLSRFRESRTAIPGKTAGSAFCMRVPLFGMSVPAPAGIAASFLFIAAILSASVYFDPDYNIFGVLTVFLFYFIQKKVREPGKILRHDRKALLYMAVSFLCLNLIWASVQIFTGSSWSWSLTEVFSVLAVGILAMDIPRGKPAKWEKYFFYIFYPAHIIIFMILRKALS